MRFHLTRHLNSLQEQRRIQEKRARGENASRFRKTRRSQKRGGGDHPNFPQVRFSRHHGCVRGAFSCCWNWNLSLSLPLYLHPSIDANQSPLSSSSSRPHATRPRTYFSGQPAADRHDSAVYRRRTVMGGPLPSLTRFQTVSTWETGTLSESGSE